MTKSTTGNANMLMSMLMLMLILTLYNYVNCMHVKLIPGQWGYQIPAMYQQDKNILICYSLFSKLHNLEFFDVYTALIHYL